MLGQPLRETIASDKPIREAGIFGHFGAAVNVTDGRYTYFRKPVHEAPPLFHYSLCAEVMRGFLPAEALRAAKMAPPFSFTKGMPVVRFGVERTELKKVPAEHELYDLKEDPDQGRPLHDAAIEQRMIDHLVGWMKKCDAPPEQFVRLGL
jgi:hypothetical protein